ncbi:hypothetical protein PBI_MRMAGOO_1 [Mycobacterium phage MrMagoo]|uniref:Uncharacterized protein n=1 Tax=Mycobacterium phage MrMagoo TaxID=1927020 RepID=A0A1L6BYD3_9CAUD|nr:hypothetical protein J4U04_gp001 [Mycobacterium phage MrMagoo]APQ42107.1 hypothetical protein PBI_MRMAGOO_1 [Mycobacterium phage MrMagoo]ARM70183.1 hypothetical protein SEA_GARDENSALSA_1 [Mycobacterium phage GardenSalsa]
MRFKIAVPVGIAAAALICAPVAQADDAMFRVGSDIMPGDYVYTVMNSGGSWELCSNTSCAPGGGLIDMDVIMGQGAKGYLTIPSSAKYLKTTDLALRADHQ